MYCKQLSSIIYGTFLVLVVPYYRDTLILETEEGYHGRP